MQHLFITHSELQSPRWLQAFPHAKIVDTNAPLPSALANTLIWVVLDDTATFTQFAAWLAAGARVIALTKSESSSQAKAVVESGGSGYLHYLAAVPVLEQVSQVVELGGLWLGADLMRQLVFATANLLSSSVTTTTTLNILTQRERAVAEAVAVGKTNKEVARELDITERTVKAHLSAIFEKLQVRDRLQLVLVMSGK